MKYENSFERSKMFDVFYENNRKCGEIEYSSLWEKSYFRSTRCGFDSVDLRSIANKMDKSNKNYLYVLNFGDYIMRFYNFCQRCINGYF